MPFMLPVLQVMAQLLRLSHHPFGFVAATHLEQLVDLMPQLADAPADLDFVRVTVECLELSFDLFQHRPLIALPFDVLVAGRLHLFANLLGASFKRNTLRPQLPHLVTMVRGMFNPLCQAVRILFDFVGLLVTPQTNQDLDRAFHRLQVRTRHLALDLVHPPLNLAHLRRGVMERRFEVATLLRTAIAAPLEHVANLLAPLS
jgi:hypothetical protein